MNLKEAKELEKFLEKYGPYFRIFAGRAYDEDAWELRIAQKEKENVPQQINYFLLKIPYTK